MVWLQGIGMLAFLVALALGWTWFSFGIARWIGRLVGRYLPITRRALALRPWIRWSKPLLLVSAFGVLAGPASYFGGWGFEGLLSGADWVLYGGGCLLNFLVGVGRGTAQRLGIADESGLMGGDVTVRSSGSEGRMWIVYIYGVLVVITAIGAVLRGAIWPGAAGLIGPLLCWWAGAGMRGSLFVGSSSQKIGGIVAGVVFMALGLGALSASGYWVSIFSFELGGVAWGLLGTAVGFFCMTRETAEGRPAAPVQSERMEGSVSQGAAQPISTSPLVTRVTYSPGKYSQVKLPDGSRYLVEVLNDALSVRKLKMATIPGDVIWRYDLYQSVRTTFSTTNLAREILDLVLDSITNCMSDKDLIRQLNEDTESSLHDYFMRDNFKNISDEYKNDIDDIYDELESSGVNIREQAKKISEDINNKLSTEEYTKRCSEIVALFYREFSHRSKELEWEDVNILGDFGDFLEDHAKYTFGFSESILPHDKMRIAAAFIRSIIFEDDPGQIEILQSGYGHLASAIPDPHGRNAMKLIDEGFGSISSDEFAAIRALAEDSYDLFNEMRAADVCRRLVKERS